MMMSKMNMILKSMVTPCFLNPLPFRISKKNSIRKDTQKSNGISTFVLGVL